MASAVANEPNLQSSHGVPRPVRALLALILFTTIGGAWWYFDHRGGADAALISGSGTIEANEVAVVAEAGGRIRQLAVEEGATVHAGDLLVALDTATLDAQLRQAEAAVEVAQASLALVQKGARPEEIRQAEAALSQAAAQRDSAKQAWETAKRLRDDPQELTAKINAAKPQVAAAQARLDLLRQGPRAELVAQAEANLRAAQSRLQQLKDGPTPEQRRAAMEAIEGAKVAANSANVKKDGDCNVGPYHTEYQCRASEAAAIAAGHAIDAAQAQYDALVAPPTEQQLAQAQAAVDVAQQQLLLAQNPYTEQDIKQAEAALAQAQANLADLLAMRDNPIAANGQVDAAYGQYQAAESAVQAAQARLDALRAGATAEQVALARAQVRQAEAALGVLQAQKDKATITAPIDGTVLHLLAVTGETAAPGMRLLTLANIESVKLTVYVPETKIGRVRLGQPVQVTVDSFPGQSFVGEVIFIADKAEFTPRNVQTQAERAGTVFAVKVKIPNPERKLKAGMPADAKLGD